MQLQVQASSFKEAQITHEFPIGFQFLNSVYIEHYQLEI